MGPKYNVFTLLCLADSARPFVDAYWSAQKDLIGLKVNKLSSVRNVLPYEYYSLPYCRPEKIEQSAENLGEVLRGDRIENSLYQIQMRVDEQCKVLCRITALTTAQAKAFRTKVDDDYRVNM
jgi:transmembrane 9 superfamily protein 2/4